MPRTLEIACCFLFTMLYLISCSRLDKQDEMQPFFESLSKQINSTKLDSFRRTSIDSSCRAIEMISSDVDLVYVKMVKNNILGQYLDSLLATCNEKTQKTYLTIAFHDYLNKSHLSEHDLKIRLDTVLNYKWEREKKLNAVENTRIAKENFQSINVGDSIFLNFPVENKGGRKSTFFYLGYPYSMKYSNADDSLQLKAVVIEKYIGDSKDVATEPPCRAFKIKIIDMSDTSIEIMNEKYTRGYIYNFCINDYGRIITYKRN